MRRTWLLLVGVLGAALGLGIVTVAQGTPTIRIAHPWAGGEWDVFQPVVEAAENALGIEIEAQLIRPADLRTVLPIQWAAGVAPADLFFGPTVPLILRGARGGHLMDLTDLASPEDFFPGMCDPVMVEGRLYALPYTQKPKVPGFWYRYSFFEEHGLAEPANWPEFLALLDQIKAIGTVEAPIVTPVEHGEGWVLGDLVENILIAFGGPQLHRELAAGTIRWTDPLVKAILEYRLVPLIQRGYFTEPTEIFPAVEKWWTGEGPLISILTALLGVIEDPEDAGLFVIPGATGYVVAPDYVFVSSYTRYPEEARALARWFATEGQELHIQRGGGVFATKPVPRELYPPVERRVADLLAGMACLPDIEQVCGGDFKVASYRSWPLLWVDPQSLSEILETLEEKQPQP